MSDLAHERLRLMALVDEFIYAYSDEDEDEARIDTAVLVAVLHYEGETAEREAVVFAAESKRRYIQAGVLTIAARRAMETTTP